MFTALESNVSAVCERKTYDMILSCMFGVRLLLVLYGTSYLPGAVDSLLGQKQSNMDLQPQLIQSPHTQARVVLRVWQWLSCEKMWDVCSSRYTTLYKLTRTEQRQQAVQPHWKERKRKARERREERKRKRYHARKRFRLFVVQTCFHFLRAAGSPRACTRNKQTPSLLLIPPTCSSRSLAARRCSHRSCPCRHERARDNEGVWFRGTQQQHLFMYACRQSSNQEPSPKQKTNKHPPSLFLYSGLV